MGQYERLMLNRLLDTYEASVLSVGLPQRTVHIEMRFTKKNMPAYFQESTNTYELIHRAAEQLEQMGLIAIFWKGGRPGHIIEKIRLCEAEMERAYEMLRRTPKAGMEQSLINLLRIYGAEAYEDAPVCNGFARFLTDRLQQHQSVKSYVDVGQPEQAKNLLEILACI